MKLNTGEFLMNIYPEKIETTGHILSALDLNEVDWNVIQQVLDNLTKLGFEPKVVDGK